MKKTTFVITSLLLSMPISYGAMLGDVSGVHNFPGYIDLNPETSNYKGAVSKKILDNGVEYRTPSEIMADLFEGKNLSGTKIQQYISTINEYMESLFLIECQSETEKTEKEDCEDSNKFLKKWERNATKKALEFALAQFETVLAQKEIVTTESMNTVSSQEIMEKLFTGIEIWEAVKGEDRQMGRYSPLLQRITQAKDMFTPDVIKDGPEATNLLVPEGHPKFGKQLFLSEQDIEELKKENFDVSLLNPPSSGMWRKPVKAIKDFDTSNYDLQGLKQIETVYSREEALKIINPDEVINVLYKPHDLKGGMTPKFEVHIGEGKWKIKFINNRHAYKGSANVFGEASKLIWGSEVNTESSINNLAAALGYTVDPTYYKKKVRLYFEDEVYEKNQFEKAQEDMIRAVAERYPGVLNVRSALEIVKTDENGRKYIDMRSVALEQKSCEKTDMNIGFFRRSGLGKDLAREHRAFFMFMAWVADPDVKDDNDKVKIVPDGDSFKIMHSNSDMGAGLGLGYPNVYNFDFVKKTYTINGVLSGIKLNYFRIYPLDIMDAVSLNDVRWFARLLGQLTLEQMEKAFLSGGYPEVVAKYYARLASKKRNQLLRVLGLIGTTFTNDAGEKVTLTELEEFTGTIAGYEEFFDGKYLTDNENKLFNPEVEHWVRNWGIVKQLPFGDDFQRDTFRLALRNSTVEAILRTTHRSLLDRTVVHKNGNIDILKPRIIDHSWGQMCENNCFVQGLDFGLKNFIPMRFLTPNPHADEDPAHPMLLVDMFRIGFWVGENGDFIQSLIGFEPPESMNFALGTRFFKIYEIMKVTPIGGISEYFEDGRNLWELPRYTVKNLRDEMVKDLKKDQSLIVSTYLGNQIQARVKAMVFPYSIPGIRLSNSLIKLSRLTISHVNDELFANWSDDKTWSLEINANIIDIVFKVPLLRQYWFEGKKYDRSYVFKDEGEERDVLLDRISYYVPHDIPEQYKLQNRSQRTHERGTWATFFGLRGFKRYVKKVETDYTDFKKQEESHVKLFEIADVNDKLIDIEAATWKQSAQVLVNDKQQMAIGLNFDMFYPAMKREKFLEIMEKNRTFLPKNTFFFDPETIKHYMGEVTVDSKILFTSEMLEKIFSPDWRVSDLCQTFGMKEKALTNVTEICHNPFELDKQEYAFYKQFKNFLSKFETARGHYQKVKDKALDARNWDMRRLARFFMDNDDLETITFAKNVVGDDNVVEKASLESNTAAFPGDNDVIKLDNHKKTFKDEDASLAFDPDIFSDKLHQSLALFFFAPTN